MGCEKQEKVVYRILHRQRTTMEPSELIIWSVCGAGDEVWRRPTGNDDIQDTEDIQILPVNILGDWNFIREKPSFMLTK